MVYDPNRALKRLNKRTIKLCKDVYSFKRETSSFFQHYKSGESRKVLIDLIVSIVKYAKRIERLLKTVEKEAKNAKKTKKKG